MCVLALCYGGRDGGREAASCRGGGGLSADRRTNSPGTGWGRLGGGGEGGAGGGGVLALQPWEEGELLRLR
jgi:hypothetical protein